MNVDHEPPTADQKPFQAANVTVLSLGHGIHDTFQAFFPVFLPIFLETFALNKTQGGFLSALAQIPSLVQPVIGYLSDHRNLSWIVILAPAVTAISMSLLGVVPEYWLIALLLLLTGLSSAGLHAVGPAIVGRQAGSKIGRGMSFWMVGGEMGRSLGPLVLVSVIDGFGLPVTPFLMIFGLLTSLLLYFRLRKIPNHFATQMDLGNWKPAVKEVLPLIVLISTINLTLAFMISGVSTFLPTYLMENGTDLWLAGALLTIMQIAGVLGAMLSGTWSDRLGRKPLLIAAYLISPLSMVLFLFSKGIMQIASLMVMGFATLSVQPILMAWIQQAFPDKRALANGLYMAITFVIRSLIVILIGWMGDRLGLHDAFLVCAGAALIGLVILLFTNSPKPSRT